MLIHTGVMMFLLLQSASEVRLTEQGVEAFLMRADKLAVIREISLDDCIYLTRLMMYKINKAKGTTIV